MKKFDAVLFVVCVVVLAVVLIVRPFEQKTQSYPQTFIVEEVHSDHIVLEDFVGNAWVWMEVEDWQEGDVASAIMNDAGTPIIYDDSITILRYSGHLD